MDQKDIKTLKVFEAIEENNSQSQRELSKKLYFSVGFTNSLLKHIVEQGYYKTESTSNNRFKYILTPKGRSKKRLLKSNYLRSSIERYDAVSKTIKIAFETLKKRNIKKVFFVGTGVLAEVAYIAVKATELHLMGVIDDKKPNSYFLDIKTQNMSILTDHEYDAVILTEFGRINILKKKLIKQGVAQFKIVELMSRL